MFRSLSVLSLALLCGVGLTLYRSASAAELYGLTPGQVELQTAGPLAFGPSGVLFVGDTKAAKVYAINTDDQQAGNAANYSIDDLSQKIAAAFGGQQVAVNDLAVNPETGNTFLSVNAGGKAGIAKVTPDGTVSALNLDKIPHAAVTLPNAPEDKVVQQGRRSSNPRDRSRTWLTRVAVS
jgi:hypothetical protein